MKHKFILLIIVTGFSSLFISCNNDEPEIPQGITKEEISGVVQKGPFNIGTAITMSELTEDLTPTGKQFTSQIAADDGSFEYSNLELVSQYVTLQADGFYFNELTGENSAAQITLFALADVSDQSTLNINVLTHLEKARVEYLISQGSTFSEAKATAQAEVLDIFSISKSSMQTSEQLNIADPGDDNAILLAISAILQGFRTDADLQEVLNVIANDIKEDGTLNNEEIKGSLAGHSLYLNKNLIRQNLEDKYNSLGETFQIPSFENYITQFNENTSYSPTPLISYPETNDHGLNILNENNTEFSASPMMNQYYGLAAETITGLSLRIEFKLVESNSQGNGYWAYNSGSIENWNITNYNIEENSQVFTLIETGTPANLKMLFLPAGNFTVQVNFYEGGDEITHSKVISVETIN